MSESVHTSRWINQIKNQNWDIYLFPSYDNRNIYKDLNIFIFINVIRIN